MPVRLLAGATERDANGLALSSRNSKLDEAQQLTAASIHTVLADVAKALREGGAKPGDLEQAAIAQITAAGLQPEYVAIRNAADLGVPDQNSQRLVVLAAARLGDVRLIDNILVTLEA
jgi:pantoate--beta-alanine ligase